MDTTIKVDSVVRDRLANLAAERGLTIRDLVERLAVAMPTRDELARRQADAAAYVTAHLRPDFTPDDVAAGEALWQSIHQDQRAAREASLSDAGDPAGGHAA